MLADKPKMVSIVLPCYNPARNIYSDIAEAFTGIINVYPDAELIVVNDGSTKNFNAVEAQAYFAAYPGIIIVSYPQNRGKGHALREGVRIARGEWVIYTDIDFPYTRESFFKILEALAGNACDLAVGIRPEEYYKHLPKSRVRISKFLRLLIRKFLNISTDDTQCGLKGFGARGKAVFLQTTIDRYFFDLEFIFLAGRKNWWCKLLK